MADESQSRRYVKKVLFRIIPWRATSYDWIEQSLFLSTTFIWKTFLFARHARLLAFSLSRIVRFYISSKSAYSMWLLELLLKHDSMQNDWWYYPLQWYWTDQGVVMGEQMQKFLKVLKLSLRNLSVAFIIPSKWNNSGKCTS